MNNKTESLKEKLRQALSSTARVISDDLGINPKKNIKNSEKQDLIELENLNSKNDFIKARAESDSLALKKKFSNLIENKSFRYNIKSQKSNQSLDNLLTIVLIKVLSPLFVTDEISVKYSGIVDHTGSSILDSISLFVLTNIIGFKSRALLKDISSVFSVSNVLSGCGSELSIINNNNLFLSICFKNL